MPTHPTLQGRSNGRTIVGRLRVGTAIIGVRVLSLQPYRSDALLGILHMNGYWADGLDRLSCPPQHPMFNTIGFLG